MRSSLAMVLVQVRFPKEVTVLGQHDALDSVMRKADFPLASTAVDNIVGLDPSGAVQNVNHIERRVYDDATDSYSVSISRSFVSLYCADKGEGIPYKGDESFLETLLRAMTALEPLVGRVPVARLGYRYVDSLDVKDAPEVVSETFLGLGKLAGNDSFGFGVCSSMVDAFFSASPGTDASWSGMPAEGIHLACGTLAAGDRIDQAIPAQNEPRWVIDVDAYSQNTFFFSANDIRQRAESLSCQASRLFFGHVVTGKFKERYL